MNVAWPELQRIEAAVEQIDPVFLNSPQFIAEDLSDQIGCTLHVKVETANPIRSFKGRGASFLFSELGPDNTIVCASVGNFGSGMAFAARSQNASLIVFAAQNANETKLAKIKALGARVIQQGVDFDDAKIAAQSYAQAEGLPFIEDGATAQISEGAGTIALEILKRTVDLNVILVPVGNGALACGIGTVVKALSPKCRVVGVCAEGAPAMALAFQSGRAKSLQSTDTVAEGIGIRIPNQAAVDVMRRVVDDIVLVSDDAMVSAIRHCHSTFGIVTEPAGVAGLAALCEHKEQVKEMNVATVLCGGNLTDGQMARWLKY